MLQRLSVLLLLASAALALLSADADAAAVARGRRSHRARRSDNGLGVRCVTAEHDVGQGALDIMRNFTESIGDELEMSRRRRQKMLCLMAKLMKNDAERQKKLLMGVYR